MFGIGEGSGGSTRHRIKERKRLAKARKDAQERSVWQTTEGEGIAEKANISLGFDTDLEEEDDEMRDMNGMGLMI
jgi:hypothetical protein